MALHHPKLNDEFSKLIATVLTTALEECRQGDVIVAEKLGLDIKTMRSLDQLKADQILRISSNYMRDQFFLDICNISSSRISHMIEKAAEECELYEMIDEYLRLGACKVVMSDLFGMRSTHVSNRKKYLNIATSRGRKPITTLEEQHMIYDAWLASINIADYRERLLYVARNTAVPMANVYREIQLIEQIQNEKKSTTQVA